MLTDVFKFLADHADHKLEVVEGAFLFRQADVVKSLFLVEQGMIELTRHQKDGRAIVLQRAGVGMIVAEASLYSSIYHCDAVVGEESRVKAVAKSAVVSLLANNEAFAQLWAEFLAREVQSARALIDILSRKTVAQRLDGWQAWQGGEAGSVSTDAPRGQWKNVAAQIGVSPEALYRELAIRRAKRG
ncbi:MAG: Crp/Fnr family transcriptional regulator [Rhizobiaceae bacterium]